MLLFVCTGNICRSPTAERIAAAMLGGAVEVTSAGTQALVGQGVHPYSAQAVRHLRGDPAGFAARQLTAQMLPHAPDSFDISDPFDAPQSVHDQADEPLLTAHAVKVAARQTAELLGSQHMQTVMAELAGRVDVILIDAPPLLQTTRDQLRQATDQLETVGARLLGHVLSMAPATRSAQYGYRGVYPQQQRMPEEERAGLPV